MTINSTEQQELREAMQHYRLTASSILGDRLSAYGKEQLKRTWDEHERILILLISKAILDAKISELEDIDVYDEFTPTKEGIETRLASLQKERERLG